MFKRWLLISISTMALLLLIVACAQPAETTEPSASEAEALIVEKCSDCHTTDRVFNESYSRDEWSDVFDDMINKGAEVSPAEKETMIDWLVAREQ